MIIVITNTIGSSSAIYQIDLVIRRIEKNAKYHWSLWKILLWMKPFLIHLFQKLEQNDFNISFFLLVMVAGFLDLFLYSFFGMMAANSFQQMSDCLYECNWNELPIASRKPFIMMIQNTQKSIYYRGFGVVRLNLETFCDVNNVDKICFYNISVHFFSVSSSGFLLLHDVQGCNRVTPEYQIIRIDFEFFVS